MYEEYYEPSDEEMLTMAIEDDAEDARSEQLALRQKRRWTEFEDRVASRFQVADRDFDNDTGVFPAQWWDLYCMYPKMTPEDIFAPDWEPSTPTRFEAQEVHSWMGDIVRSVPRQFDQWFELTALTRLAQVYLNQVFGGINWHKQLRKDGPMMHEPDKMRIRIFGIA